MVFSGRSNPVLGEKIAEKLGINLGGVLLKTFANGEIYARLTRASGGPTPSSCSRRKTG